MFAVVAIPVGMLVVVVARAKATDGATPLYIACYNGHEAVAGLVLDQGADVNEALVRLLVRNCLSS